MTYLWFVLLYAELDLQLVLVYCYTSSEKRLSLKIDNFAGSCDTDCAVNLGGL